MSSPEASPSDSSTSPPPPSDESTTSPPPPSDASATSPPPPSDASTTSPPPPSDDSSTSPPPPSESDNGDSSANSPDRSPSRPSPPRSGNSKGGDRDTPRLSSSDDKPKSKDRDSHRDSVITGVAVSVGLLILVVIAFMVICSRRRKKKRRARDDEMKYYLNSDMTNNYNKMPPPPLSGGMSSAGFSDQNWHMAPPPPPPMMSGSDLSSVGFSGPHQAPLPPPHPVMAMNYNKSSFTYDDLAAATRGFAQENLLGQGGFGYVHKGVLPNGKEIAVKSLKANSGQGEREFQAEVDIISRVHHRHLVSLVGYCIAGSQRMLVYEFVPNGNLEYHLHGTGPSMDWPTRLQIAVGSAKGFAYLHEDCHPRIIHRDIKAANILLDENFEAKVADFGLAKLSSDNFTHVSTRIMGTFGYLAPEYASTGKLTEKSDCYSYGIMLLELITGRRPIDMNSDDDGLVDWARPILVRAGEGGSYEEMVDPRLGNNYDRQEMLRAMLSAAACIRHSARRRPKMSQIVRALEGDVNLDDLTNGKTPHIAMFGSSDSESDLKKLGKGTSSQEFSNSDEGGSREMPTNRNSPHL